LKTFLIACAFIVCAASAATWWRFQSFDPCIWMEKEIAEQSSLPFVVAEARVKAEFLLRGITEPSAAQCVGAWWRFRMEGAMHPKKKES